MKFIRLKIGFVFFFVFISFILLGLVTKAVNRGDSIFRIVYPRDGILFPPEFHAPTFIWEDSAGVSKKWLIKIDIPDKGNLITFLSDKQQWKPEKTQWEKIKKAAWGSKAVFTVAQTGSNNDKNTLKVAFSFSSDSVGAPIFYRDVPLPFSYALRHLDEIRWRLGYVNSDTLAGVVMEKLPACANCHCFSADGRTIAMDLDAHSGKDAYGIANIEDTTVLHKIIRWSVFQGGQPTYALLTSASPDGKYFVSTLKDNEFFVVLPDLAYSQLFFPIKGILVTYDRDKDKYSSVPGADDTNFVQSNPVWSPCGKNIYFTKAKAIPSDESGFITAFDRDSVRYQKLVNDFYTGSRQFKYDIYKIPFNGGKGGMAQPIDGASANGTSNYFPKISPDGKWMVFCRAKNYMLLQPDSRLYIVPAGGGEAREMNCNTNNMNSWHSWSPNSKWLVFSSKMMGTYTKLYLTHIDENGNDSPPVMLEHLCLPDRVANLPEFVNIPAGSMQKITPKFLLDDYFKFQDGVRKVEDGDLDGAIQAFDRAATVDSNNFMVFGARGYAKMETGNYKEAIKDFDRAIMLKNSEAKLYNMRGFAYKELGMPEKAVEDFGNAIKFNPRDAESYNARANVYIGLKKFKEAIFDCDNAVRIASGYYEAYYTRGLACFHLGEYKKAIKEFDSAIKLNSEFAHAWLNRGIAKINLGDKDSGCSDIGKAVKLGLQSISQDILELCN